MNQADEVHPRWWVTLLRGGSARQRESARSKHWGVLALAGFVMACAFMLRVLPDGHVALRWGDMVMPESCPVHELTGHSCPGCGLTRSFILLAEGNWRGSLEMNRMGVVLALAVVVQFPYRGWLLWRRRAGFSERTGMWVMGVLMAGLALNWIFAMTVWPQEMENHEAKGRVVVQSGR